MSNPTPPTAGDQRFDAAARRFADLFEDLRQTFAEREDAIAQVALALLSREHVLMTGPPGSAKSGVASMVLRRIVDEATGEPSLFARQFTESTVQTDLVGPINFKTLMETGRTEHFTDEGMLGAVHAFLDEVFDGRDMLLRSTLNVLQERELKQGGKTTRGRIECALMTTNRYLAEVLESSRETLLAFVDRIAFVSFVPKGFARPNSLGDVLKKHVNGPAPFAPNAARTVTIQDLDVLQAAVDAVVVPDELLDVLVKFLADFEQETTAAERADTSFIATRYLSTRTAVRLGKVLRAVAVYDRIFEHHDRDLEVRQRDLEGLRYALLLCGPPPDEVKAILGRETDPRERRQLSIVRTEREIFDRCLKKVPPVLARQKPRPIRPSLEAARKVAQDPGESDTKVVVSAMRELAEAAQTRAPGAEDAAALLDRTVGEMCDRALGVGLTLGTTGDDESVEALVLRLGALAETLEKTSPKGRPTARWLRGRAARLVDEAARLTTPGLTQMLGHLEQSPTGLGQVEPVVERCIAALERLHDLRSRLRAAGADLDADARSGSGWRGAVDDVEGDLVAALDAGFRADVQGALAVKGGELVAVLDALAQPFSVLDRSAGRLATIRAEVGKPGMSALKARVVGPRIRPLVSAAFARIDAIDGPQFTLQVERLLRTLRDAGLGAVLSPKDLLAMTASAVVRCAAREKPLGGPAARAEHDRTAYRKLRDAQRVPGSFTLLELALRLAPAFAEQEAPAAVVSRVAALARDLPKELSGQVVTIDLDRLDRTVSFFERWWAELTEAGGDGQEQLTALARSGFFQVTREERALLRFSLETRLVAEVFPEAEVRASTLRARLEHVEQQSQEHVRELLRKRADQEWTSLLGGS